MPMEVFRHDPAAKTNQHLGAMANGEVYSLLKRVDEKFVTEKGYNQPRFVEDVVRNVAERLGKDGNFTWYSVEAENYESIHNHSAYAYVEKE